MFYTVLVDKYQYLLELILALAGLVTLACWRVLLGRLSAPCSLLISRANRHLLTCPFPIPGLFIQTNSRLTLHVFTPHASHFTFHVFTPHISRLTSHVFTSSRFTPHVSHFTPPPPPLAVLPACSLDFQNIRQKQAKTGRNRRY